MKQNPLENETEPLHREAIEWITHLTSGTATAKDAEAFERWRRRSAAHEEAVTVASRLWRELEPAGRQWRQRSFVTQPERGNPRVARRALLLGGAMAACAAGAYVVARPPLGLWPSWSEMAADFRTGTGEQRAVSLFGAVDMRMNTKTSVALRASENDDNRIDLLSGEASFTVPREKTLVVGAGEGVVSASSAQFAVSNLKDEAGRLVCVTCVDGALQIRHRSKTTDLNAEHQFRYNDAGLESLAPADMEAVTAWQRGVLIFRSMPLRSAIAEVNRYRPGHIAVTSSRLGSLIVSGRFRIDDLDEFLGYVQQAFNAKAWSLPGNVVLLS